MMSIAAKCLCVFTLASVAYADSTSETLVQAPVATANAEFGSMVAVDDDIAVISTKYAPPAMNQQARVYRRDGHAWAFEASVGLPGTILSLDVNDGVIALGRGDRVELYRFGGGAWLPDGTITTASNDMFGASVSLDGDMLAIGSTGTFEFGEFQPGSVWIYRHDGTSWVFSGFTGGVDHQFGRSVVLDAANERLAVAGTTFGSGGYVRTFRALPGTSSWDFESSFTHVQSGQYFGKGLALDGDMLAIGVPNRTSGGVTKKGAVLTFTFDGAEWVEDAEVAPVTLADNDGFGSGVAMSEGRLVGGTSSTADGPGFAVVFVRSNGEWREVQLIRASADTSANAFGAVIGLSGDMLLIGAPETDGVVEDGGAAYIHDLSTWSEVYGGTGPFLSGNGVLGPDTPVDLKVTNAVPNAQALLWISTSSAPFEALGGTVYASPIAVQVQVTLNAQGGFTAGGVWPAGIPSDTEFWFQFLVQDTSSPFGIRLTNGLRAETP